MHDRTKWDFFLNMGWSEYQNYYTLYKERKQAQVSRLNKADTFEGYMAASISELIK